MSEEKKSESNKSSIWDTSPLSPQWTVAAVFVLIVFFTVLMKVGLSA